MKSTVVRFDGPFWAALLAGVMSVGSASFFGLAAAAQDAARSDAAVVSVSP